MKLSEAPGTRREVVSPEMLDVLKGAKWLIDPFVFDPAYYKEYLDICVAIKKARGEE